MKNIKKRKLFIKLAILGNILYMIGDWLLDAKLPDNVTNGFVESSWAEMSMWRFEVSIWLGALGTCLSFLGLCTVARLVMKQVKKPGQIMMFGAIVGSLGTFFIHSTCCLLPILWKVSYSINYDVASAALLVNTTANYLIGPLCIFFVILDGCLSIPFIYVVLKGKLAVPKWAVLCNPLATAVIGIILQLIPFYPIEAITGAFESLGHLLMCVLMLKFEKGNNKIE